MEHPLAMDIEAMRRAAMRRLMRSSPGSRTPTADPVLRRAEAAEMRSLLCGPPPEQARDYHAILAQVVTDVLPYASRTDHPGYFAFVPSFTTWPAALAELMAARPTRTAGPGWSRRANQVELEVIDWFRRGLGCPPALRVCS